MALSALRGAVGFLTRLPAGADEADWNRFQAFPAAFPLVGYLVGAFAMIPFVVLAWSPMTAAFGYLLALVAVTGIAHLDGVADLGDAAAVHGGEGRRDALTDTTTGVGGVVAVAVVVAGLALAGIAVGSLSATVAAGLVVASEVGAKLGMATVACLGAASHEGLGSGFTEKADPPLLLGPALAAAPAALLTWPSPGAAVAVLVGPLVAVALVAWSGRALGGVSGDVFGATNELARVLALHVGVIVWMRF